MLRGDHGSCGGTLPHRPSKKPDPVLPTDSVCGLFHVLPREIRDEIYDLISQPKEETHKRYYFKTLTRVPHARLINKRFTKEYDESPALNTHLEVTQCFRPDSDCLRLPRLQGLIPSSPAQTRFLHFYLLGCIDPPWRGPHVRWSECLAGFTTEMVKDDFQRCWGRLIHDLVSVMPVLKEISIGISCCNMRCVRGVMLSHDIWKGIPHLCRVALLSPIFDFDLDPIELDLWYGFKNNSSPHLSDFYQDRQILSTWTSSEGWVIDPELEAERLEEESRINHWID
jgi:hypothetical protein